MAPTLDILAVTDLHYTGQALAGPLATRRGEFGALFLRKALHRLKHQGQAVDLVVILGDLVDRGTAEGAAADLDTLARTVRELGVPAMVVPGNHDLGPAGALHGIFTPPGLYEFGGYGFWVFHDEVGEGDRTTRSAASLAALAAAAARRPDLPLIALQHNPLAPHIAADYPYMLTNEAAALRACEECGAMLSLSGHYHAGQPPERHGPLTCYTVPALCEAPFRFAHIRLEGRAARITEHHLPMDVPGLVDTHCHTEFAYCGTTVRAAACIAVSEALGLAGLCLTEHTFQLYFDSPDAWSWRWQSDAEMVRRAWATRAGRMDAYRAASRAWRSRFVRLGLEVDLLADGQLLLAPEDRDGWDLLVGAVHVLPGYVKGQTTQAQTEEIFLRHVGQLLQQPIQVLAHPFRFFRREGLVVPTRLYGPVAELLASHGVAAEVNFHTNQPDPRFYAECAARGVRIALGSDSHDLVETGEFTPHLRLLEAAGIGADRWRGLLLCPAAAPPQDAP